jgi:hypothetical protein
MAHGHPHEEAEHAQHHAADPFDKRVALAMVVIAALLAGVKILGHRTHNDTLGYQIKAGVTNTEASNLFNFFQAKRQRMEQATLQAQQIELLAPLTNASEKAPAASADEALPDKDATLAGLTKDLEDEKVPDAAAKAGGIVEAGEKRYRALRKEGYPPRRAGELVRLEMDVRRYRLEADAINARAKQTREKAETYQHDSEHKHHQATYFDLGELFVELALVLSSVAILTKRPGYWYAGMAVAALGVVLTLAGFFV